MGDLRTTTGEKPPLTQEEKKLLWSSYLRRGCLVFLLVLLLGFLVQVPRRADATGYVTTEGYAEVRPPVTGTVAKVLVFTGDTVQEGQLMVQLNSEEEEATLAEAKARHSRMAVNVERRKTEMDVDLERRTLELNEQKQKQADAIRLAELQLENANTRLELTRRLVQQGLKAEIHLTDATLTAETAKVALQSLKSKDFTLYEQLLQKDREKYAHELASMQNELAALADAVHRAEARLRTRQVRAPIAGKVVRYEFVPGELLQPSTVLYEIFGGEQLVLKLRVPERYSTKVAVGQRYKARLRSFPGLRHRRFRGQITSLRDVIQGEDQSTWRVAWCDFNSKGLEIPPGTTASAAITYGKSSFWAFLFQID